MQRALLPAGGLAQEVQQQYARALMQQAYKLLPSAALLGDPYGMLRTLRQRWDKVRRVMRHTPWPYVPAVALHSAADLLRAGAASFLRATTKSARAISSGLEALLSEQHISSMELNLPEAALRGVGGLARETARAVENALQRINEAHPVPPPLQGVLALCLLPVGFGRGVQRLILLLTLASLALMRSTAEACRGLLLGPAKVETGRSRAPRAADSSPLYPMCAATLLASAPSGRGLSETNGELVCAALASPCGMLVLTPTTLRCTAPGPGEAPQLQLQLARLLLVQQRGRSLQLIALSAHEGSSGSTETHSLSFHSDDDAARLHEVLRLAGLNARGAALPPINPRPTFRTTILELLG